MRPYDLPSPNAGQAGHETRDEAGLHTPSLARALAEASRAAHDHYAASEALVAARRQLLADWSKYQMLLYPPADDAGSDLEPEEVRLFLTREGLAGVAAQVDALGALDCPPA